MAKHPESGYGKRMLSPSQTLWKTVDELYQYGQSQSHGRGVLIPTLSLKREINNRKTILDRQARITNTEDGIVITKADFTEICDQARLWQELCDAFLRASEFLVLNKYKRLRTSHGSVEHSRITCRRCRCGGFQ
ncbi:hypothetical protein H113_00166 [Trichophyton rubrum MR1459]|uniref:Uncharacterized protein n=2 Tax=Trichophyton TaxID=5550 RepID=A0A022WGZ9_TRIRU|nr:hypothetical protein H100_00165 [Trichophyton rubrum MR850]EZF46923.1 hypothetical protein H102_00164 [Trichophyton rubrum CBS 100081]EZF57637.1 hypothetical protein H103_00166 [Trichophyton rubrum CBS 288.86]EZF68201.1 hypothetical protein H104_00165 [Trichophyton rubrum CBS 289.86]EZF78909.1 hypothetical protein H105_00156 [Trichophyton soudanense CBS 452.61]EZG00301.1 hypothetical protein H113_00166 [Trichophyton rubrum MR1459]EZG11203.1 hypothetical protein H106_00058 [Trichophyton rub